MDKTEVARRPIKARSTRWASRVAAWLGQAGVRPNTISIASVFFAAGAGFCLTLTDAVGSGWRGLLFLSAGVLIQIRLLCNLFDGMVAVEGGHKTKSGEIYNELPDRVADVFILVGAGYAWVRVEWGPLLGWLCAVLALLTAYVRFAALLRSHGQAAANGADDVRLHCVRRSELVRSPVVPCSRDPCSHQHR
jgi:phosphatidylglycerophosphate synthase